MGNSLRKKMRQIVSMPDMQKTTSDANEKPSQRALAKSNLRNSITRWEARRKAKTVLQDATYTLSGLPVKYLLPVVVARSQLLLVSTHET